MPQTTSTYSANLLLRYSLNLFKGKHERMKRNVCLTLFLFLFVEKGVEACQVKFLSLWLANHNHKEKIKNIWKCKKLLYIMYSIRLSTSNRRPFVKETKIMFLL